MFDLLSGRAYRGGYRPAKSSGGSYPMAAIRCRRKIMMWFLYISSVISDHGCLQ